MPTCRCGRFIQSGRLCDQCQLETGSAAVHTDHEDLPECPNCGGATSGEGVVCYKCRGDDR